MKNLALSIVVLCMAHLASVAQDIVYGTTSATGPEGGGTVFSMKSDGTNFKVLHAFKDGNTGSKPRGLALGSDGMMYGVTRFEGKDQYGSVFKYNPATAEITALHFFSTNDGIRPLGKVVVDGTTIYGTCSEGGNNNNGTIFKINTNGSGFVVLRKLSTTDGTKPESGLIMGSDGVLYGTANNGGSNGDGTVFKINKDGTGFTVLKNFKNSTDGDGPIGLLSEASDGLIYGTTFSGGANNRGIIYKIKKDGSGFTKLYDLNGNTRAGLIENPANGLMYGFLNNGIYSINKDGTGYQALKTFDLFQDGQNPQGLPFIKDGFIYGACSGGGSKLDGTIFRYNIASKAFTVLKELDELVSSSTPGGPAIFANDGFLYFLTAGPTSEAGSMIRLRPDGTVFSRQAEFMEPINGRSPKGGLALAKDGYLYGTTSDGGRFGFGTVFRIKNDGTDFSTIKSFEFEEGKNPRGSIIQGSDGYFYGTCIYRGYSAGSIYRINATGSYFKVIGEIDGNTSTNDGMGFYPLAELYDDGSFLYGTTSYGAAAGGHDYGGIFKISYDGSTFDRLVEFTSADGTETTAGVVEGSDGFLYGANPKNQGRLFKIKKDGSNLQLIKSFSVNSAEGNQPLSTMYFHTDGFLYGTNSIGPSGSDPGGTLFKLKPDGSGFVKITNFTSANGQSPDGPLRLGPDGQIYGSCTKGGSSNGGTIYKVNPATGAFTKLKDLNPTTDGSMPMGGITAIASTANVPADFALNAEPKSLNLTQGSASTTTVSLIISGGFSNSVNLSVSGLPTGVQASFSPVSISGTTVSTLTLTAASDATISSGTVLITGVSGGVSRTLPLTLNVNPATEPDFSLTASPASVTLAPGASSTSTIQAYAAGGFTGTINLSVSNVNKITASLDKASVNETGNATLSIATDPTITAGAYELIVSGLSGDKQKTVKVTINIQDNTSSTDFTLNASTTSLSIPQGAFGTTDISFTPSGGFSGTVALSIDAATPLPAGVTAQFTPASISSGSSTLRFDVAATAAPAGPVTLIVKGESGGSSKTIDISLTITEVTEPDFVLNATPQSVTISQGGGAEINVTITELGGFSQEVDLTANIVQAGLYASFNPNFLSGGGQSLLTITADVDADLGAGELTITATSGTIVHTVSITLQVEPPPVVVVPANQFSPNGDGIDDTWQITDIEQAPQLAILVFDRTGQVVFQTTSYQNDWDGTSNGKQLLPATYYFVIRNEKGENVESGSVNLIR